MKVICFPDDGQAQGSAMFNPVPNDWHITTLELKRQVEEKGWSFHPWPEVDFEIKDPDVLAIYNGIPSSYHPPPIEKSLLIILEPPIVKPRLYERLHGWPVKRVLTFSKEVCDNRRVFYIPFPVPAYNKDLTHIKRDKYICAISSGGKTFPGGLYEDRRLAYLGWGKDLDLYGWGWHKDAEIIEKCNYMGPVADKVATLAMYRYAIVFENLVLDGYNSEKFYHCLQANTVPLYRGSKRDILPLSEVTEVPWCKRIMGHLEAVSGT